MKPKMKKIAIRKAGPVRLTAAACSQYKVPTLPAS